MKEILKTEVPLWGIMAVVCITGAGMLGVFFYFGDNTREYLLSLPGADTVSAGFQYGAEPKLSDPDYFGQVKRSFIEQGASFIEADLSAMRLTLYKDGVEQKEVDILTKGREGSWWETPAGIYKIESKEKNHFSSFGHVYQPWSMAFQGNFFIHGWPYYEDGTPVKSAYSGGCIRLADEDAEAIYALAERGMPVLVFEADFAADDFQYVKRTEDLSAGVFLAADVKNNFVFLQRRSSEAIPLGRMSQFLLALVSAEYINMEKSLTLDSGTKVTPFDLLHLMLLESSDEPFTAFASVLGENRVLALMDAKARAVGMRATSIGKTTTAEDLFYLAKYLYNNRSFILKISAGEGGGSAYGETRLKGLLNGNLFGDDPRFIGGKFSPSEGTSTLSFADLPAGEAGASEGKSEGENAGDFLGVFEIFIRGEKRPIFVFLHNSSDIREDIEKSIAYIEESYR